MHGHPWKTAIVLLCILSISIVPVILPTLGFSAIGPVAESIAAAWQSSIGIVAAGTPFSLLQSAAMGGAVGSVFYGAGVAGLAGLAVKKVGDWAGSWNKRATRWSRQPAFSPQKIVQEIRDRHDCDYKGRWRRIEGPHGCEECGYRLPRFKLDCRPSQFQSTRFTFHRTVTLVYNRV